ncbi:MAG: HK97 family phage prohead protease [Planctomycetaceae bacterium]
MIENRSITSSPAIATKGDKKYCEGYAVLFYNEADPSTEFRSGKFAERIPANAKIDTSGFCYACLDHNEDIVLDHTEATLNLSTDKRGIRYSFPIMDNDPDHQRLDAKLTNGHVKGASFQMTNIVDEWQTVGETRVRSLKSFTLRHVSPTYLGCYRGASAELRSENEQSLEQAYLKFETQKRLNKK